MTDNQSSDAVRRKRPAARRPLVSNATAQPASGGDSDDDDDLQRDSAVPSVGRASTSPQPERAEAREAAAPKPVQVKRATARRPARAERAERASSPPPPASPAAIAAEPPVTINGTSAPHAAAVRGETGSGLQNGARALTRALIAHHVRDASRLAARLAGADTQPPEHESLLRRLARFRFLRRSDQVDDFGLDPDYEAGLRPFFDKMCNDYFRTQVDGVQHVPVHGRAILVGNHSGALPWDGIMLRTALRLHHESRRELRWLVEDHVFHAPFLGSFVNRIGAVRACQENAERLLHRESLLAVFPEGIKGIAKPFAERYKLQRFGRGGYVRLALRTGAPVIPVAIVGAEEAHPLLFKVSAFSKSVGLPFIPVTPTFPWLGPLGIAPLPSRWRIAIGPPIREIARHDADAANDDVLVHELNECVRASVRGLLDDALRRRGDRVYSG